MEYHIRFFDTKNRAVNDIEHESRPKLNTGTITICKNITRDRISGVYNTKPEPLKRVDIKEKMRKIL